MSTEPVATEIVAADVHVDYDGHEVLAGVDLRAAPGRMVAVTEIGRAQRLNSSHRLLSRMPSSA